MRTIDDHYLSLARRCAATAEIIETKFTAIVDGEDEDGEPETECLIGIRTDRHGVRWMVFSDPDVKGRATSISVDAILDLANLIRMERQVTE